MVSSIKIIRNTLHLTSAFVARKFITLARFTLIVRYLDVPSVGLYALLTACGTVYTLFLDFGLSQSLIRESAARPAGLNAFLRKNLTLKLTISMTSLGGLMLWMFLADYSALVRKLVFLVALSSVVESLSMTFCACLRAQQKMKYEAQGILMRQSVLLALTVAGVMQERSILFFVTTSLLSEILNLVYVLFHTIRETGILPRPARADPTLLSSLKGAIPLTLTIILMKSVSFDTLILSYLATETIIGLYSVPATVVEGLQIIPSIVASVIFPALSYFHVNAVDKLKETVSQGLKTLLLAVLPIVVILFFYSREIIRTAFGAKYTESAILLQILSFSLIPNTLSFILFTLLNACNREKLNVGLMLVTLIFRFLLTYLLIKEHAGLAIVVAAVIGQGLLFLFEFYFAGKLVPLPLSDYVANTCKSLGAALLMALLIILLKGTFPFVVVIPIAFLGYLLAAMLIHGTTRQGFDREKALGSWIGLARRLFRESP